MVKAIRRRPPGAELLVVAPEGRRAESIATDLATEGLEDMAQHSCCEGDEGVGTGGLRR